MSKNIILCGFMGTGKSTVGKLIAEALGWRFVDTDQVISEREGKPIRQIFAEKGETYFRDLETELCRELYGWEKTVIATGGGIVLRSHNRQLLRNAGIVVCLQCNPEILLARLADDTERPLLQGENPESRLRALLAQRQEAYDSLPHQVDTTLLTPQEVAQQVVKLWQHSINIPLPPKPPKREPFPLSWSFFPHDMPLRGKMLFDYELNRQNRNRHTKEAFLDYRRTVLTYAVIAAVILLLLWGVLLIFNNTRAETITNGLISLIIFASLLITFIGDFIYMVLPIFRISNTLRDVHWDIVRLTPLEDKDILMSLYGVEQARSWRMMMIEIGSRVFLSVIFIMVFYRSISERALSFALLLNLLVYFVLALVMVANAITLIMEPQWRMRCYVMIGMYCATIQRNPAIAMFIAIILWALTRLFQSYAIAASFAGMAFGGLPIAFVFDSPNDFSILALIALFFGTVFASVAPPLIFYSIYHVASITALRRVQTKAFRRE